MRLLLVLLLVLFAVPATAGTQTLPLRFGGEAQVGEEPPILLHVELIDSSAGVTGTFTTEDAKFDFTGTRQGSRVNGTLKAGDIAGPAQLQLSPGGAEGKFDLGGQSGVLRLRHTTKSAQAFLHPDQRLDLTAAEWRDDLDELVSILTTKHGGPFDHVSRPVFFRQFEQARRLVPRRTGIQNALQLRKLAALIGDGHTGVAFVRGRPLYPLETFWFADGVRVVAAPPELKDLLGARVVAVNGVPSSTVINRLRPYIGQHETEWAYRSSVPWLLQRADLLEDSGITTGPAGQYTFEVNGRRRTYTLQAGSPRTDLVRYGRGAPLWERNPEQGFWHERWPDGTVYLNWRTYDDLDARSADLLAELEREHPKRLIVDLRDSGGGDFKIGRTFIDQLRERPWLNRRGVLYVLVGRRTFSAAMTNGVDLKLTTNATLVGEPAGATPNGWQEVRSFFLPNSGLRVSASTRKYEFLPGKKQLDPDVLIPAELSDWPAENDAATRYVLRQP